MTEFGQHKSRDGWQQQNGNSEYQEVNDNGEARSMLIFADAFECNRSKNKMHTVLTLNTQLTQTGLNFFYIFFTFFFSLLNSIVTQIRCFGDFIKH